MSEISSALSNPQEWPDELDALSAAPENHVLLLENERVRVLDTVIPSGCTVPLHTHCWPGTLYLLSWSDFVRRDRHGSVLLDSRTTARPSDGAVLWAPAMPPHTLENVGESVLRLISVELKTFRDAALGVPKKLSSPSDLVRVEAHALESLAQRLDRAMLEPFSRAIDLVAACAEAHHRVVLLGIGKSGLIARKIAATLTSTGTPAHFLHPAEALHGDIGSVYPGDVAIALSASGETEELLRLVPALRRLNVSLISFTGALNSSLGRASEIALDCGVAEEACTLNLAPTASTTVMLALGDALAIEVSRRRNFQARDFADIHPGGHLGRRLTPVRDLMHSGDALPHVAAGTPMSEVIYEMSRKKLGVTTVLSQPQGHLLGIVSDGDLRRLLQREGPHALEHTAGEIMNSNPVTVGAGTLAPAALALMEEKKITTLVVTQDCAGGAQTLGVVHLHDLWTLELA